jgi:hypothetical protein
MKQRFSLCVSRARWLLAAASTLGLLACGPPSTYAVHFKRSPTTPGSASVIVDEQYIGPLSYIAAHGIRVEAGVHRISIEKDGYFPYDQLVEAETGTLQLDVALTPIPD